jgi:hypothetical protein
MPDYTVSQNISEVEWLLIRTLRDLMTNNYGELWVTIHDGRIADIIPQAKPKNSMRTPIDREMIRLLQT